MKFLQLLVLLLIFVNHSCYAPKKEPSHKIIHQAYAEIVIDGKSTDAGWADKNWRPINQKWLGSDYTKEDFYGKYKLAWTETKLYVLALITDDVLIDKTADGLVKYWDDDCLEIFIDENASGGNHQFNYNAFAYHVALNGQNVDIGLDSLAHYYDHIESKRYTSSKTSTWELAIDIYDDTYRIGKNNLPVLLDAEKQIGFAIAYCDNDKSPERENFIGSAVVKGEDKNRCWIDAGVFEKFVLR